MTVTSETDRTGRWSGDESLRDVLADVEAYYSARVAKHGATPLGVDWSCWASQNLRFVQLLKLCDFSGPFVLNDIGCGFRPPSNVNGIPVETTLVAAVELKERVLIPRGEAPHELNIL